jgi:hypothetical protein
MARPGKVEPVSGEASRQPARLTTRMKVAAPQALIVAGSR